jgi:hypothetical protein
MANPHGPHRCVLKKISLLKVIAPRYLSEPQLKIALDALDVADMLREDRNFIIHGAWFNVLPECEPCAASIRPKADPNIITSEFFPHSRMKQIISTIIKVKYELVKILQQREASEA